MITTAKPLTRVMALHALTLLIGRGLAADIERHADLCELQVIPPLCPLGVSPADFSHADELITRAYESTHAWLASGLDHTDHAMQVAGVRPHVHM